MPPPALPPIVAVIAPGAMGSAVAACMAARGVEVRTSLAGRSDASAARARRAGMIAVEDAAIVSADIVLSIVPPGEAVGLAERLAPALRAARTRPVYVDCNAISPATVARVAAVLAPTGCEFVDGGIIGPPPEDPVRPRRGSICPDPGRRGWRRCRNGACTRRCWMGRSASPRR